MTSTGTKNINELTVKEGALYITLMVRRRGRSETRISPSKHSCNVYVSSFIFLRRNNE